MEQAPFQRQQPVADIGAQDADGRSADDVAGPMPAVVHAHRRRGRRNGIGAGSPPGAVFPPYDFRTRERHAGVPGGEGVARVAVRPWRVERIFHRVDEEPHCGVGGRRDAEALGQPVLGLDAEAQARVGEDGDILDPDVEAQAPAAA